MNKILITTLMCSLPLITGAETRETNVSPTNSSPTNQTKKLIPKVAIMMLVPSKGEEIDEGEVVSRSLSSFLMDLKDIDVIPFKQIYEFQTNIKSKPIKVQISEVSSNFKPDFLIWGTYRVRGENLNINLYIRAVEVGEDTFKKKYRTETDIGIFDAIDKMTADTGEFLTKKKIKFASIKVILAETTNTYEVYLNKRKAGKLKKDEPVESKCIAEQEYTVYLSNTALGRVVHTETISVPAGEELSLVYVPKGWIKVSITNYDEDETYYLISDGKVMGSGITNFPALEYLPQTTHPISVRNSFGNEIRITAEVYEGQTNSFIFDVSSIEPKEKHAWIILGTGGGSIGWLGLEYSPFYRFSIAGMVGGTSHSEYQKSEMLSLKLALNYTFLGKPDKSLFRAYAGATFINYFFIPEELNNESFQRLGLNIGVRVKSLFAEFVPYYSLYNKEIGYSGVFGVRF